MENSLDEIHKLLGITPAHRSANRLELQKQAPLEQLKVVEITATGNPFILHSNVAGVWQQMKERAAADGITLAPHSGFRSYLHQKNLIQSQLQSGKVLEEILVRIAIPGYSEHHTGYAIDLHAYGHPVLEEAFEATAEYQWLLENACEFGFHLSYPRNNKWGIVYEPWHWFYDNLR